jgi:hypothetical protein
MNQLSQVKNIGPEGQRTRLRGGLTAFGLGIIVAVILVVSGLSRWWRLLLFLPFWQAALGVFQALHKT